MSASLNKATIIGHLGRDPEVRSTGSGQAVANFSVATSEKFKNSQGESTERTEWHDVVAWGKLAELCGKYLAKGRQVYVEGRIQTREYEKDGQKRRKTEIVANSVIFLGGGGAGRGEAVEPPADGVRDLFGAEEAPF